MVQIHGLCGTVADRLTGGVSVEGEPVGGAAGETGDLAGLSKSNKAGAESSGGLLALKSKDVGGETSNVGGSHGGSGDGVLWMSVSIARGKYGCLRCVRQSRWTEC